MDVSPEPVGLCVTVEECVFLQPHHSEPLRGEVEQLDTPPLRAGHREDEDNRDDDRPNRPQARRDPGPDEQAQKPRVAVAPASSRVTPLQEGPVVSPREVTQSQPAVQGAYRGPQPRGVRVGCEVAEGHRVFEPP